MNSTPLLLIWRQQAHKAPAPWGRPSCCAGRAGAGARRGGGCANGRRRGGRGRAAGCRGVPEQRGGLGGPAARGALAWCARVPVEGKPRPGSLTSLARPARANISMARPPCIWRERVVAARPAGPSRAAPWLALCSAQRRVPHAALAPQVWHGTKSRAGVREPLRHLQRRAVCASAW